MTAPSLADLERARDHAARVCAQLAYTHGDPRAVERYAQEYRRYADQITALRKETTGATMADGVVVIGGRIYRNSWVEDGKQVRLVICRHCEDTGEIRDDDGRFLHWCDCTRGWANDPNGGRP